MSFVQPTQNPHLEEITSYCLLPHDTRSATERKDFSGYRCHKRSILLTSYVSVRAVSGITTRAFPDYAYPTFLCVSRPLIRQCKQVTRPALSVATRRHGSHLTYAFCRPWIRPVLTFSNIQRLVNLKFYDIHRSLQSVSLFTFNLAFVLLRPLTVAENFPRG